MIKRFNEWLLENEEQEPKDPQTAEQIGILLHNLDIHNWNINDDLTVDVDGDVILEKKLIGFNHIPIKFKTIEGTFDIDSNELGSLEGLADGFSCEEFHCRENFLESLHGLPKGFKTENFFCDKNYLQNFIGLPSDFQCDEFYCDTNDICSLEGFPDGFKLEWFGCSENESVSPNTISMISKCMFREGLTWKQTLISCFYSIPEKDWKEMTMDGKSLPSKEEFKKKYIGGISSKRLGL